ncbi:hypothetical protein [Faecalibacillus intestinalis]|uniref:hypothetical protein n=1 Tax=Faecalibacillus intestinalis TaxID=1982626 RepID=UPI0035209C78
MKVEIDDLKIELEKESEKVEYVKPVEKENRSGCRSKHIKQEQATGTACKITYCRGFLWCKFT